MTSLPAADCSMSLLLQWETCGRRWFEVEDYIAIGFLYIWHLRTCVCRLAGVQPVNTSVWLPNHSANPGTLFAGADIWIAGGDAWAHGTTAARPVRQLRCTARIGAWPGRGPQPHCGAGPWQSSPTKSAQICKVSRPLVCYTTCGTVNLVVDLLTAN